VHREDAVGGKEGRVEQGNAVKKKKEKSIGLASKYSVVSLRARGSNCATLKSTEYKTNNHPGMCLNHPTDSPGRDLVIVKKSEIEDVCPYM